MSGVAPVLVALGLAALLVGGVMVTVGVRGQARTAARRRAWVAVDGVVTRAPGFLQPTAEVSYPLPDGSTGVHRTRRSQQDSLDLGSRVQLLVDPADPEHGVERVGLAQTVTGLVLPLVGGLLVLGGLGLLAGALLA